MEFLLVMMIVVDDGDEYGDAGSGDVNVIVVGVTLTMLMTVTIVDRLLYFERRSASG